MPYSEYFNYLNCNHSASRYGNYADALAETSHTDYNNSHNNHDNSTGVGCETSHTNHSNYLNTHYDYVNHQTGAHSNYSNHTNYSNPNSGAAKSLTWTSPWSGDTLNVTYIAESVNALKQLRDNVRRIATEKSQQNASVDVSTSSSTVGDNQFNDSNPSTHEYVEEQQFDAIRNSLNNLWAVIKGDDDATTPGVPDREQSDIIQKSDWELLKTKADDLMEYVDSGDYANTVTFTGTTPPPKHQAGFGSQTAHTNHSNYMNNQTVPYNEAIGT
jgi:hypothetical protein